MYTYAYTNTSSILRRDCGRAVSSTAATMLLYIVLVGASGAGKPQLKYHLGMKPFFKIITPVQVQV